MTQLATDRPTVAPIVHRTWTENWARAYAYGHNAVMLRGQRLAHFANAYADIAEEAEAIVPDLELTLESFWIQWDAGDLFEGTPNEDWHFVATR